MVQLNNPLVLFAGKLLGIGVEVRFEHTDGTKKLCFEVEVVAWSYCKEWSRAG
jgi:hypothetical protein